MLSSFSFRRFFQLNFFFYNFFFFIFRFHQFYLHLCHTIHLNSTAILLLWFRFGPSCANNVCTSKIEPFPRDWWLTNITKLKKIFGCFFAYILGRLKTVEYLLFYFNLIEIIINCFFFVCHSPNQSNRAHKNHQIEYIYESGLNKLSPSAKKIFFSVLLNSLHFVYSLGFLI